MAQVISLDGRWRKRVAGFLTSNRLTLPDNR